MVVQLIAKDKHGKLHFKGRCKVTINAISELVLVEAVNEEYKMICAMFKWKFVAQKNILFIFAENDFQDFALIFDGPKKCRKIYEILVKKGVNRGSKELIKERFLPSIFEQISKNDDSSSKLKEILLKWIEFFDENEKKEYIQILKENNVYDSIYLRDKGSQQKNSRKRKAKDEKSSKNTIVEAPNFELRKYYTNGTATERLLVFSSPDKKLCYEYFWYRYKKSYVCSRCLAKKKQTMARIIKQNGKDVVLLNGNHVCKILDYKIILKPNFETLSFERNKKVLRRLIVFLDSSRNFCYEYTLYKSMKVFSCTRCRAKNHSNIAELCQKEDRTEFIVLKSSDHICEPIKYSPEKYREKQLIQECDFKLYKIDKDGIDKSKLIVFTSPDKTYCYEYHWRNSPKGFLCCGCDRKKKHATAEIFTKPDGSNYVKLNRMKHVCEPFEYDPGKYDPSKRKSELATFKLFNNKLHSAPRLVVFYETNKNLCYEYCWNKLSQLYQCSFCPRANQVTATLWQNNEKLTLSKNQHVCDLREFDPEKYKELIVKKEMYKLTSTILRNKAKENILTIFTSEEKKLYYKFVYHLQNKYYYCSKCYFLKLLIIATLQNEGKENEILYVSNQKHICEALKYSTLTNGNKVMAPNFQLIKRKSRCKIVQRMIVFTNEEKSECYEYGWCNQKQHFQCNVCKHHHSIHVFAKIVKNIENEEWVELSKAIHKCKPIKFVPENLTIVKLPNFKLFETDYRGNSIKKLAILDSKNKDMGYVYNYEKAAKKYLCLICSKKNRHVSAQIFEDENGQNFVVLNDGQHLCELQKLFN